MDQGNFFGHSDDHAWRVFRARFPRVTHCIFQECSTWLKVCLLVDGYSDQDAWNCIKVYSSQLTLFKVLSPHSGRRKGKLESAPHTKKVGAELGKPFPCCKRQASDEGMLDREWLGN